MTEQPLSHIDPSADWQVRVRIACAKCEGTGKSVSENVRMPMGCLACGSSGYMKKWMRIDDVLDVLDWRRRRNEIVGGA